MLVRYLDVQERMDALFVSVPSGGGNRRVSRFACNSSSVSQMLHLGKAPLLNYRPSVMRYDVLRGNKTGNYTVFDVKRAAAVTVRLL